MLGKTRNANGRTIIKFFLNACVLVIEIIWFGLKFTFRLNNPLDVQFQFV
jgi:hypothetical protein